MSKWNDQKTEDLLKTTIALKTLDEAKRFFRDLMTGQELIEFGNRWQAAKMLSKNIAYTKIEKEIGLSSATIARVSKWLNKGMDGYKLAINRINRHNSSLISKKS
jgi:TrpR-related protein YerC/YecD